MFGRIFGVKPQGAEYTDQGGHRPRFLYQNHIFRPGTIEGRPQSHASVIIEGPEEGDMKTLYVAWFCGTEEGNIDVAVMLSKIKYKPNDDPGAIKFIYSEPKVIADDPERACGNPVIFFDDSGRLHLWYAAFYAKNDPKKRRNHRKIFYKYSDDRGETWSDPVEFSPRDGLWVRNPILVLKDGTWLLPMNDETTFNKEYKTFWSSLFAFSEDKGKSWRFSRLYSIKKGMIQPSVVQFDDGELLCINRSRNGWVAEMRSKDNGNTWTTPIATHVPNPNSCVVISRYKPKTLQSSEDADKNDDLRGDLRNDLPLVMVYNPLKRGRHILSVATSNDRGYTWVKQFDLQNEPKQEFSYPSIVQSSDGLIHITYTYKRITISHDVIVL